MKCLPLSMIVTPFLLSCSDFVTQPSNGPLKAAMHNCADESCDVPGTLINRNNSSRPLRFIGIAEKLGVHEHSWEYSYDDTLTVDGTLRNVRWRVWSELGYQTDRSLFKFDFTPLPSTEYKITIKAGKDSIVEYIRPTKK